MSSHIKTRRAAKGILYANTDPNHQQPSTIDDYLIVCTVGSRTGRLNLPGGGIDPQEIGDPTIALRREIHEEIGSRVLLAGELMQLPSPVEKIVRDESGRLRLHWTVFAGEILPDSAPCAQEGECGHVELLPYSAIMRHHYASDLAKAALRQFYDIHSTITHAERHISPVSLSQDRSAISILT